MATTSLWKISGSLKKVLDYAENPDKTSLQNVIDYASDTAKTDDKLFVTGINCDVENAYELMTETKRQFGKKDKVPSEKAFAYKMRLEAMKRQAGRPAKDNSDPTGPNLIGTRSNTELAQEVNESETQIKRYIRLTNLIPDLLELVDEGRIAMRPAVEISYLPEEAQMQLYETIDYNDATPSHYQAIRLRNFHRDGKLTPEVIEAIMSEEKPNQKEKSPFRDKRIVGVIPKNIPQERHCEYVIKAIDFYNRHLERVRNNRSR